MEREVGGGIRMGNTCKPMAVSFQCMTKSTTKKKKKRDEKKRISQLFKCLVEFSRIGFFFAGGFMINPISSLVAGLLRLSV